MYGAQVAAAGRAGFSSNLRSGAPIPLGFLVPIGVGEATAPLFIIKPCRKWYNCLVVRGRMLPLTHVKVSHNPVAWI